MITIVTTIMSVLEPEIKDGQIVEPLEASHTVEIKGPDGAPESLIRSIAQSAGHALIEAAGG